MRIAFIQDYLQEAYGIMYISACLKQNGHECEVFVLGLEKDIVKGVMRFSPQLIGISCTTGSHVSLLKLAKELKSETNALIIFGGAHATCLPEDVIRNNDVDIVCIGEGENAMLELANAIETGRDYTKICNLWVKQNGKIYRNELRSLVDVTKLPQPDWSLYNKYNFLKKKDTKTFIYSRGCPFRCGFCSNRAFAEMYKDKGKYVRFRTVGQTIEEIKTQHSRLGFRTVVFDDDLFALDRTWLEDFLKEYKKEINLPFFCALRADLVTEELIIMLKEAGCYGISFGIESGNEFIRNKILLKGNISNERIIAAGQLIRKHGIILRSSNMMCLPEENIERALETVEVNIKSGVQYPFVYLFQPLPKTHMYEYCIDHNLLDKDFSFDKLSRLHFDISVLNLGDKSKIQNLQRLTLFAVHFPFLLPLIRKLIYLPSNPIFDFIFLVGTFYNYSSYKRMSLPSVIKFGFYYMWTILQDMLKRHD